MDDVCCWLNSETAAGVFIPAGDSGGGCRGLPNECHRTGGGCGEALTRNLVAVFDSRVPSLRLLECFSIFSGLANLFTPHGHERGMKFRKKR